MHVYVTSLQLYLGVLVVSSLLFQDCSDRASVLSTSALPSPSAILILIALYYIVLAYYITLTVYYLAGRGGGLPGLDNRKYKKNVAGVPLFRTKIPKAPITSYLIINAPPHTPHSYTDRI